MDVQVTPLVATTGAVVGAGITFVDVTRYRRLQEALQESKRDIETAYEELQSTVEELETTNEELQSTNEELETLNEELHSTNEELETMNDELNDRSLELNHANAFLGAVLSSLNAGVVVVNNEFEVEAWNAAARELWGLSADEVVGRHLLNLDIGLPVDDLRRPLKDVFAGDGAPREVVLAAVNRRGRSIDVRVSLTPLAAPDGATRGAIMLMQPVSGDN